MPLPRWNSSLGRLARPLPACDFIKIDVQSFELFVLRGGIETLKRFRPTLFLEISPFWMSKYYDYKEIYKLLTELNYDVHHVSYPEVPVGQVKEWSGRESEEWDILARPKS